MTHPDHPDPQDPPLPVPDPAPITASPLRLGPFSRPERRVLIGDRVTVAPLDAHRDADSLFDDLLHHDPGGTVWRYLPVAFGREDRQGFRRYMASNEASPDPLFYSFLSMDSGECVGHASLMRFSPEHGTIEIGWILLSPSIQRTATATEALVVLMDYAMTGLGYRRLEWKCNALNRASRRAALRLGFTFEGVFRQHMIVKGANRDSAWFSLLDSEWPARRERLLAWLNAGNFTPEGHQIRALSAMPLD